MVWRPKGKKLPWPEEKAKIGTPDDQEWNATIAKWQALVEEAGPEHSGCGGRSGDQRLQGLHLRRQRHGTS